MAARKVAFSEEMGRYFASLMEENQKCYAIAEEARSKGMDPETRVEIPQAEDLASRVEKLLADYNVGEVADDIRRLTEEFGNRELVSLEIAKLVAKRPAEKKELAVDRAIRVGLAVLTEGILVAPLEGLADTKIKTNSDGSEYIDLIFAGPIRAAGGTAQAMSVLIADVVRQAIGIGKYIPTPQEVDRFIEEIPLYKQCQHLQYTPSTKEIQLIVRDCPICIDGEGTERMEISGFRDLPRIDTNQVRGGACLVIAEGLCLKAAKIKKHVDKLGITGWEFLDEYLAGKSVSTAKEDEVRTVKPADKYLKDLVAGRPIFGHPSRVGAFRLRYGRGRTCGLASLAYSPATMYILDEFPALGTQLKIERPGKACVVTPCDELEGPIVLLKNGDLVQCNTAAKAKEVRNQIVEIVDCGEILVPFGEFCENNHFLAPCGYPIEWHKLELKKHGELPPDWQSPTWERALEMSRTLGVPLHPKFNLFWNDIEISRLQGLRDFIITYGEYDGVVLIIHGAGENKKVLEELGALHTVVLGDITITDYAEPLLAGLGLGTEGSKIVSVKEFSGENSLDAVSKAMGIEVRARAMTRIGTRMGRPEKAKDRRANSGLTHGLFPVTSAPDFKKELKTAAAVSKMSKFDHTKREGMTNDGLVMIEMGKRVCPECKKTTFRTWCRDCGVHTDYVGGSSGFEKKLIPVDIDKEYHDALQMLGTGENEEVKLIDEFKSRMKTPEALEKAILRAKNDVIVYKDGTIRFDMTDIPITHFRPKEIGLSVEKAKELGYVHDWNGEPLVSDEQLCELKVQDVIPNIECGKHLVKVANFIDDMLERFYGMDRYYNAQTEKDMIGQMGIGLAPHTSGGILCRIIGYTNACGCFGHPFFHAGKRRNCDGDEDCVMLLLDGLLNFSRAYIPSSRGGLMDTPLVLTTRIDPNEIDKEAHNVDCLREYPLEFYEAAMQLLDTKKVEKIMDLVAGRIGTEKQYGGFGFTHDTANIAEGPIHSAYTTLETMMDKMNAQLELGKKIRAVDEKDVATKVIDKHFMPDMIGNLRSFSAQSIRCTRCGEKYRRIPLSGKCICGNNLTLTVHEASVKKYLQISQTICEKYGLSEYTKERIDILSLSMDSLFNSDKIKKCKLSDFF